MHFEELTMKKLNFSLELLHFNVFLFHLSAELNHHFSQGLETVVLSLLIPRKFVTAYIALDNLKWAHLKMILGIFSLDLFSA